MVDAAGDMVAAALAVQPASDSTVPVLADIRRHFADMAVQIAAAVGESSHSAADTADN